MENRQLSRKTCCSIKLSEKVARLYCMSDIGLRIYHGSQSPVLVKFPDSRLTRQFIEILKADTSSTYTNSLILPGISGGYFSEALIFIKPRAVLLSEYCGTICSLSCACQLYSTVLRLCLFCDYRNCNSTPQVKHNFPDLFPHQ